MRCIIILCFTVESYKRYIFICTKCSYAYTGVKLAWATQVLVPASPPGRASRDCTRRPFRAARRISRLLYKNERPGETGKDPRPASTADTLGTTLFKLNARSDALPEPSAAGIANAFADPYFAAEIYFVPWIRARRKHGDMWRGSPFDFLRRS